MRRSVVLSVVLSCWSVSEVAQVTHAMDIVRTEANIDIVTDRYGLSGQDVLIAILDRGIDWTHPDFRNPDGTTRIRAMLDMTGLNGCTGSSGIAYTEEQINQALAGDFSVLMRDAVGHGTVTAGVAAGNGSGTNDRRYRGVAPKADLIVIKVVSEGAPAHSGVPAETSFQACLLDALDWLDEKISEFGLPCVAIINSGTQWGPMDGTSIVSRKIDEVFGLDRPGRIFVSPSGDEGNLPTHAARSFTSENPAEFKFTKFRDGSAFVNAYYTGGAPTDVSVVFADGDVTGPVAPGRSVFTSSAWIINYMPGTEFYPWISNSGDFAIFIRIDRSSGSGRVIFSPRSANGGTVDIYHGQIPRLLNFTSDVVPGRLIDYATTHSAIVVGAHVARSRWTDIDGNSRVDFANRAAGPLWSNSAAGPTRDGRVQGVHLTAPGHNVFAAYATDSYYATARFNIIKGANGFYGRLQATSGAAPIVVGAVALLLEFDSTLTARQVRQLLQAGARPDAFTGTVPSSEWGAGKLDLLAVFNALAPCRADLDGNQVVNELDLGTLLVSWGTSASDLDADGVVDGIDLALLLASWGSCTP